MHQSVKHICTIINLFSVNNFVYHACVEFIHFFSLLFFLPIINMKYVGGGQEREAEGRSGERKRKR